MKYQANPVIVDAFKITEIIPALPSVRDPAATSPPTLILEDGQRVFPHWDMLTRIKPVPGDYWVIQSDGYIYLNPKDVFERKYAPVKANAAS